MKKIFTLVLLLLAFALTSKAQVTYGPTAEPPEGVFVDPVGTLDDQLIGRPAGKDVTFSNMPFSNRTNLYFAVLPDSVKLSLDGATYTESEHLTYSADLSTPESGHLVWTGKTNVLDNTRTVYTRFVINIDNITSPASLISGEELDPDQAPVLLVEGPFHINMQFQASYSDAGPFEPHLVFYDRESAHDVKAYSSINWGWYWENSAPELEWPVCITEPCNITAFVDEGDTVAIGKDVLNATDVESDSTEVYFTVQELPIYGSLLLNGEVLAVGDTISQASIDDTLSYYVHDGSETTLDSAGLRLSDGDGAFYTMGEDTTFYLYVVITPVNDPPELLVNEVLTLDEGAEAVIPSELLYSDDSEGQAVTYTFDPEVTNEWPENGILKLDGVPLSQGDVFTQTDIDEGKLSYKHGGSETTVDGFVFKIEDTDAHSNGELYFFDINITLVNDLPRFTANSPTQVTVWEKTPITSDELAAADEESDAAHVTFTIEGGIDFGVLTLDDVELTTGSSFTMQDILDGKVEYFVGGGTSESDYLLVEISDEEGAVASDNGYTVFKHDFAITLTGVDPQLVESFNVYPNPGNGYFQLNWQGSFESYSVINVTGQMVESGIVDGQNMELDLTKYRNGMYILRMNDPNGQTLMRKLIIR